MWYELEMQLVMKRRKEIRRRQKHCDFVENATQSRFKFRGQEMEAAQGPGSGNHTGWGAAPTNLEFHPCFST
jgi:hypothetical protein